MKVSFLEDFLYLLGLLDGCVLLVYCPALDSFQIFKLILADDFQPVVSSAKVSQSPIS